MNPKPSKPPVMCSGCLQRISPASVSRHISGKSWHPTPICTALAARHILGELAKVPPRQRFAEMVRSGLIDKEGRLR